MVANADLGTHAHLAAAMTMTPENSYPHANARPDTPVEGDLW